LRLWADELSAGAGLKPVGWGTSARLLSLEAAQAAARGFILTGGVGTCAWRCVGSKHCPSSDGTRAGDSVVLDVAEGLWSQEFGGQLGIGHGVK